MSTSQWLTLHKQPSLSKILDEDERKKTVIPKVRDEVSSEKGEESPGVDRGSDGTEPNEDTDVRDDDLTVVMRREHHSRRVIVYQNVNVKGVTTSGSWGSAYGLCLRGTSSGHRRS